MLRSQHSRTLDEFEKVTAMEPSAGYHDSRHEEAPFVVAYSVAECSDGGQNSSAHEPCMGRRGREDSVPHVTDDDNAQKPNREVCAMLISTGTMVAISASDDAGAVRHGVRVDTKAAEPTSQIESSTPGGLSEPSLLETISETIDDGGGGNKVESPRKPPAASKQQQRGKQPPIGTKLDQRTALELLGENCMESHNQENSAPRNAGFAQESVSGDTHNPSASSIKGGEHGDVDAHGGARGDANLSAAKRGGKQGNASGTTTELAIASTEDEAANLEPTFYGSKTPPHQVTCCGLAVVRS